MTIPCLVIFAQRNLGIHINHKTICHMKTKALFRVIAASAFLAASLLSVPEASAQEQEEAFNYAFVSEKPTVEIDGKVCQFTDFGNWLNSNAKTPEGGQAGRVICQITISSKGEVKDVKVVRGIDEKTDAAAVELVKQNKKWTPGKHGGKAVATSITIPIFFR